MRKKKNKKKTDLANDIWDKPQMNIITWSISRIPFRSLSEFWMKLEYHNFPLNIQIKRRTEVWQAHILLLDYII